MIVKFIDIVRFLLAILIAISAMTVLILLVKGDLKDKKD